MSVLVDRNILLRLAQPAVAEHQIAADGLARLRLRGAALHMTPQNVAEFWNVATRAPRENRLGFFASCG